MEAISPRKAKYMIDKYGDGDHESIDKVAHCCSGRRSMARIQQTQIDRLRKVLEIVGKSISGG